MFKLCYMYVRKTFENYQYLRGNFDQTQDRTLVGVIHTVTSQETTIDLNIKIYLVFLA